MGLESHTYTRTKPQSKTKITQNSQRESRLEQYNLSKYTNKKKANGANTQTRKKRQKRVSYAASTHGLEKSTGD